PTCGRPPVHGTSSLIFIFCPSGAGGFPADLGPAVPTWLVRVPGVVDLERERVLKVVAGLLVQALYHHRPVADVDDLEVWRAWHAGGNATHRCLVRKAVRRRAPLQLCQRADVTQFADAVGAV